LFDRNPGAWRDRFVVEFLGYAPGVPAYSGIRTHRYLYVEYENARRELYDLRTDPFELRNLLGESRGGSPDGVVDQLRRSMEHITEG
jgi:N-acetylglucosamine-6-sulfatase